MKQEGWIEVICGSMFSGKSEELIRRVRRVSFGKLIVQVFKPELDNRYSEEEVVSHNGTKVVATPVKYAIDILDLVNEETQVVAIDEVQFFDPGILSVVDELANNGKRVICAGLDQDFRGEPFGPIERLMALARK